VMVVDPNSDFFRFMRSPNGGAAPSGSDATPPTLARKR
jgi:modulator of FtsH protease HflC